MIIFIKGKLDTLNLFIDEMIKGFEDAKILDFRDPERFADDLIRLDPFINEDTQVISFNNVGAQFRLGGRSYWESKGAAFYNILVDHPIYYLEEISANFYPKMHTVLIDRGHEAFLRDVFPALSRAGLLHFLPHGGTELLPQIPKDDSSVFSSLSADDTGDTALSSQTAGGTGDTVLSPQSAGGSTVSAPGPGEGRKGAEIVLTGPASVCHKNKDIDILYIGSFRNPEGQEYPDISFCDASDFYRFMQNYYETAPFAEAQDGVRAYEKAKNRIFRTEERIVLTRLAVACVEWRVIKEIRIGLLEALVKKGLRVSLFGGDMWKDLAERYPKAIDFGGMVSSKECLDLTARAKILLNFQPFFGNGAHERIFNGMRNGAVVFTNRSRYLEERFTDGEDLFFYETDLRIPGCFEDAAEKIADLLSDEEKRQQTAESAYRKTGDDLWRCRVKELLQKG